jgi:hypothetical protein
VSLASPATGTTGLPCASSSIVSNEKILVVGFRVPISPLVAVVDQYHAQAEAAIDASLVICVVFYGSSAGALLVAVTLDLGQLFPRCHRSYCSKCCPGIREGSGHRSFHGLDGCTGLASMPSSVFAPGAVLYDPRLLLSDSPAKCSFRDTRKRVLLHSVEDGWEAMQFMMNQVPKGKPRLARTSGFAERSTRHSSVAVERSLLESFAALIHAQGQVRAQEPLPKKPKTRKLL